MKQLSSGLVLTAVFMLTLSVSLSFPKAESAMGILLLNGKAVDAAGFSPISSGKVSLVTESEANGTSFKIPFYAYIRRNGVIIDASAYAHNHAVSEVDIAQVLRYARAGDELIIDPATREKSLMRKTFIVRPQELTQLQRMWLYSILKKNDGC